MSSDPPISLFATGDDCSSVELSTTEWEVICQNEKFAYLKSKKDSGLRRCACRKAGKYFWTYGKHCDAELDCYP